MKILVVYYSLGNNTRFIAETIAGETGADMLELKLKSESNVKGPMKYLIGGKQVVRKETPELCPPDKNPDDYDLLIIGTPVWAWTYTPALKTFLASNTIRGKKIALFCCHAGGPGKALENIKQELPDNTFLGESDYRDPLKSDKEKNEEKARLWSRELLKSI